MLFEIAQPGIDSLNRSACCREFFFYLDTLRECGLEALLAFDKRLFAVCELFQQLTLLTFKTLRLITQPLETFAYRVFGGSSRFELNSELLCRAAVGFCASPGDVQDAVEFITPRTKMFTLLFGFGHNRDRLFESGSCFGQGFLYRFDSGINFDNLRLQCSKTFADMLVARTLLG